ncbi:hypothetical protein QTP88_019467 [Uroleucon formosanum]
MVAITKILILITAITAISGKALNFRIDTDRPSARVSEELLDTLSRLKLIASEYDELDFIWPLWTKLDELSPTPKADTINNNSMVSQHENQRKRRQALVKTRGADGGEDSVMAFKSFSPPLNLPRFPNAEVVNYTAINKEVFKWIRQQFIINMITQIRNSTVKTEI